jgi:3-oxoacyl-[acyl-carrier protein] reductase
MDLHLKDKVAMVAGSSKGLGFGIAQALAEEGAAVSMGSRTAADIRNAAEKLAEATGSRTKGYVLDASKPDSIRQWFEDTVSDFGQVDILVINAGGPPAGKFDDFSDDDWQAAYELTLMSGVRMIRHALPLMRKRNGGSILAVTSTSVKEPIDNLLLSNVMRSGLTSLLKSLSFDLAKENIRVNNLVPGGFDTDRMRALNRKKAEKLGISIEEQTAHSQASIPMGRLGTIEELGRAAAFLSSPAAAYITGETLIIDGGFVRTVW